MSFLNQEKCNLFWWSLIWLLLTEKLVMESYFLDQSNQHLISIPG